MITAFVELSLAITPAYLGRISQLTSKETLHEVRVCVVYVELHSFVARVIIKVSSLHATSKYGKVKSLWLVRHIGKGFAIAL
ncbi:hypothetical protein YC2023_058826 [Brassica napus]